MVIIFSKISSLVITVKLWIDVRQNGFFCLIYFGTRLKKKSISQRLIKSSPGNSDEHSYAKRFGISVVGCGLLLLGFISFVYFYLVCVCCIFFWGGFVCLFLNNAFIFC